MMVFVHQGLNRDFLLLSVVADCKDGDGLHGSLSARESKKIQDYKSKTFRLTGFEKIYIPIGSHLSTAITRDCSKLRNHVMNRQMTNMTID